MAMRPIVTLGLLATAAFVGYKIYEGQKQPPPANGPLQPGPAPVNGTPTEMTTQNQSTLMSWFSKYAVGAQQATPDGQGNVFAAARVKADPTTGQMPAIDMNSLLTKVLMDQVALGNTIMVPSAYVAAAGFGDEKQLPDAVTVLSIAASGVAAARAVSPPWVILMQPKSA